MHVRPRGPITAPSRGRVRSPGTGGAAATGGCGGRERGLARTEKTVGERKFGPQRLVNRIAAVGIAEIHLTRARGIGGFEKYVALKMSHHSLSNDEHFVHMIVEEAKITVQLQHVNIAQVF